MASTVKEMLETANASVDKISVGDAKTMAANENALILDVRDGAELAKSGRVAKAHHVSRGMLEFRADEASPYYDAALQKDRPIIIYCASGGRAALAGKLLQDMGYKKVYNLGGFKDWVEAGGEVEEPTDPGM